MSKDKVVLAYSGGLDTTAVIPWLKETFDYEVICCCVDCGQGKNWMVWMKEQKAAVPASSTFWMLLMNSAMSTLFPA